MLDGWHNPQENNINNSSSSHPPQNPRSSAEPIKYITPNIQRKLPALAKVRQQRIPNAYDKTALKLEVSFDRFLHLIDCVDMKLFMTLFYF